jgi:hypothetical protein
VGAFVEFYGPQRFLAGKTLGLDSVVLPQGSYAFGAGFPTFLSHIYRARALSQGLTIIDVRQVARALKRGPFPRLPCSLLIPSF